MVKVHAVQYGRNKRMSYSRIQEILEMPNLIAIQKNSYQYFCEEGLKEVFRDVFPITDYSERLVLEFVGYNIQEETNYTIEECKEREATYSSKLYVRVRIIDKSTGVMKEDDIFFGDFPRMTDNGTFIMNGAERVIVSQLVRSPGAYFEKNYDKTKDKDLYNFTLIPNRGAWLECEIDHNELIFARIDRTRKVAATTFLRALGFSSDEEIINLFSIANCAGAVPEIAAQWGPDERLLKTFQKESGIKDTEDALIDIYKKLRPGEPAIVESARTLINNMLFDPRRYDLAKVGRYKYNKKLSLSARITNRTTIYDIIHPETGELLAQAGDMISEELAIAIQNAGINEVCINTPYRPVKVIGNNTVDLKEFVSFDPAEVGITEFVHFAVLKELLDAAEGDEELLKKFLSENIANLVPKHVTVDDIISSYSYIINLAYEVGNVDDIDHLGNRRIKCVGELLQNTFRIGLARLERAVRERMATQDMDAVTPAHLINVRPVTAAIKEFFGSSQLSQFMDQTNPLAELANKRRLSALGPGGLNRDRATFEVRDVHYSHYGRMCPIETPEGPNIGLIGSLSTYARINEYGFIEAPYRKYDSETGRVTDQIDYLMADEEDRYIVAQANEPLDEDGHFINKKVVCRYRDEFIEVEGSRVNYMDVSPKQVVSVAAAMIPFLENDDASRALMGCNMQRQAVPLMCAESPIVATGIEYKAAVDSGSVVLAEHDGTVVDVTGRYVDIKRDSDGQIDHYTFLKYIRSNQDTCINQKPIVKIGEKLKAGDVIADGPATDKGEIALGRNTLIGFMTWEGYNYEDAVLINENLVKWDAYTSIHIDSFDCEARDTKLGAEEITNEIPHVGEDALRYLDAHGVIIPGSEVRSGDILVGKVTPKGETELTAEERLLRAIFGEKSRDVRDTSLRVPHGKSGIVVDVKEFDRSNSDELAAGVNRVVKVYVAQKRKLSVGDKMAGRHGNKGVVSRILPEEDMPFLPDGTPLEIVLNPLGVPSRMNIGQVLEVHLGYAAKTLGWKIATPVFDGASENDIFDTLKEAGLPDDGKIQLYDGRTGEPFDNKVTVGYMYYLKLHHLVDDKIHARSTGPYSLVTQQPLGGKAQFGGQRFGEMEVWALEAYGAAYTLQEILTIKSDDTIGRVKAYEAIVKGENIPKPGIPESFKVLVKELQSLALDVNIFAESGEQIPLNELEEGYIKFPDRFRLSADNENPDAVANIAEKTNTDIIEIDTSDITEAFMGDSEILSDEEFAAQSGNLDGFMISDSDSSSDDMDN